MTKQPLSWILKEYLGYALVIVPFLVGTVVFWHFVIKFW
jgi:hypothetical protein